MRTIVCGIPGLGGKLSCTRESGHDKDSYTVAVICILGFQLLICCFLRRNITVFCMITGKRHFRADLRIMHTCHSFCLSNLLGFKPVFLFCERGDFSYRKPY